MSKNILYKKINSSIDKLSNFNEIDLALSDIDKDDYPKEINILHKICRLHIAINDKKSPYGDNIVEIAKDNRDLLVACLDNLNNPIIKGRIADILWLTEKVTHINNPIQYAQKSIENFSKIALSSKNYFNTLECYQRALILHAQTKKTINKSYIISQLNEALSSTYDINAPFYQYNCAKILSCYNLLADFTELIKILTKIGEERYSKFGITNGTIEYFQLAVTISKRHKMQETNNIMRRMINMYIEESDKCNQGIQSRIFSEKALKIARQIPREERDDDLINKLEVKIFNNGKIINNQLCQVTGPAIDIEDLYLDSQQFMSNITNTKNALMKFSQINAVPLYSDLHKLCIENNSIFLMHTLVPSQILSHDGRSTTTIPCFNENDINIVEQYMTKDFNTHFINLFFYGYIKPSLQTLLENHKITIEDIKTLCQSSYIVPQDRIELISKGLYFGFQEDFQTAIYLLSPQVENIIRQILKAANISTTHIDKEGYQTENSLNSLLTSSATQNILDKDTIFMLQALFTSQIGPNIRNNTAHGLLNDQESNTVAIAYAWWFIFRWIIQTQKEN